MKKVIVALCLTSGCGGGKLKVEPVKVEPIHLTIDINLHAPEPARK